MRVEVTSEVHASPYALWQVLADVDRYPVVRGTIANVERNGMPGFVPGTGWKEQRRVTTILATAHMTVTQTREPEYARVDGTWDNSTFVMEYIFTPHSDRTDFTLTMEILDTGSKFGSKLLGFFGRVTKGVVSDVLKRDIDDIAVAAASRA